MPLAQGGETRFAENLLASAFTRAWPQSGPSGSGQGRAPSSWLELVRGSELASACANRNRPAR
ncbi:hypothetical protein HMPREF9946_04166 [Acetobacteraceae bacterium AT-5844]|nr:hypothetical protein HMPREF9946_04166 [Acetobacteraceae bacterium AT-5844]